MRRCVASRETTMWACFVAVLFVVYKLGFFIMIVQLWLLGWWCVCDMILVDMIGFCLLVALQCVVDFVWLDASLKCVGCRL
jgi:hypothetical protein